MTVKPDFLPKRTSYSESVRRLNQGRIAMAKTATKTTKKKPKTEAGKKKKVAAAPVASATKKA
jgi:hypothetical protein